MQSTPEPELPDPVPASDDAVTPDLPAPGPEAPDIRVSGGERSGTDAADEDGGQRKDTEEPGEDGGQRKDTEGPGEDRPAAGPGTPAPQEQTD
ncbi:hypothetical protein [Streptomyces sp. NPDC048266]|uniref:hypothetical protein n=1 Tax=unclassified Streptomyces TaxID=2593676 RepID=UPI0034011C37